MTVHGEDFVTFAEWMLNHGSDTEICYRCTISRAYYGSFHFTIGHFNLPIGIAHKDVLRYLEDNGLTHEKEMLLQLKTSRENADYHLDNNFGKGNAIWSIKLAKKIIDTIKVKPPIT